MHEKETVWPASKERLMRDFCLDENKWCSYFVLLHKLKTENKVKDLQYRILTFIYNTNVLLVKKKIKDSNLCDFCKTDIETLYHLFYNCPFVKSFWTNLETVFKSKLSCNILLSIKEVILGDEGYPELVNVILLYAKYYIHKSKLNLARPCLDVFFGKI